MVWKNRASGNHLASGKGSFILKVFEIDTVNVCNAADLIMHLSSMLHAWAHAFYRSRLQIQSANKAYVKHYLLAWSCSWFNSELFIICRNFSVGFWPQSHNHQFSWPPCTWETAKFNFRIAQLSPKGRVESHSVEKDFFMSKRPAGLSPGSQLTPAVWSARV